MKNISKKKILIIVGIVVLCIIAIFVIRKLTAKETKVMTLSEQIDNGAVTFGSYNKKSIKWEVLDKDLGNHKALLFCVDSIDYDTSSNDQADKKWSSSNLRDYLNGDFCYSAFFDTERNNIIETPIENPANPILGTEAGPNTVDKIFVLNFDDAKKYLNINSIDEYNGMYGNGIHPAMWVKYNSNLSNKISGGSLANIDNVKIIKDYPRDANVELMDTVTFGLYPQSDASGNTKEPIEWIVLDKQDGKALLLSKYLLDSKKYNEEETDITWEQCTLRKWLNTEFLDKTFSEDEKNIIERTKLKNAGRPRYNTKGGKDTDDYIFCLSIDDCRKYFSIVEEDKLPRFVYAIKDIFSSFFTTNNNKFNDSLITKKTNYCVNIYEHSDDIYWLRSPGIDQDWAAMINNARAEVHSRVVDSIGIGVRPAMWIKIN